VSGFPEDFCLQLTAGESAVLRSQFATSNSWVLNQIPAPRDGKRRDLCGNGAKARRDTIVDV